MWGYVDFSHRLLCIQNVVNCKKKKIVEGLLFGFSQLRRSLNALNMFKPKLLDFALFWIFLNTRHVVSIPRHPTSCCSVAEIMSVLFFHTMKYRYDDPRNFNNDRFIMSKVRTPLSSVLWHLEVFLGELKITVFVVSPLGSCSSGSLFHVGGSGLSEGDGAAQSVSCWLHHGEPLNLCRPQTVERMSIAQVSFWFICACVVFIVEASAHGLGHWLYRAGSRCGLWNGLHWKIFWQIKVILHQYHNSTVFCFFLKIVLTSYYPFLLL